MMACVLVVTMGGAGEGDTNNDADPDKLTHAIVGRPPRAGRRLEGGCWCLRWWSGRGTDNRRVDCVAWIALGRQHRSSTIFRRSRRIQRNLHHPSTSTIKAIRP